MIELNPQWTEEELKKIALGIFAGAIVTSEDLPADELPEIFMPVGRMMTAQRDELDKSNVAVLFSHYKDALSRGVNSKSGHPIFAEAEALTFEQWEKVCRYRTKIHAAYYAIEPEVAVEEPLLSVGDIVRRRKGRKRAKVASITNGNGGVMLEEPLEGFLFWNAEELVVVLHADEANES